MSRGFTAGDEHYMTRAIELARKGDGKTTPNPLVGAVAVKGGRIVGEGWHAAFGKSHAEPMALRGVTKGATLYVSLEPCVAFKGKHTPSCAELLAKKSVARVYVAHLDPNPRVAGKGVAYLRRRGIDVRVGLQGNAARELNRIYVKNMKDSLPYVAVKMASSLDGRIALGNGASRWVTSHASRVHVHRLRSRYQAVLTTARTVLADDPHLGVRHVKGRDPLRIILDRKMESSSSALVYRDANVVIVTSQKDGRRKQDVLVVSKSFQLNGILKRLYDRGVCSILVEAGGTLNASFFHDGLIDYVYAFVAPVFLGSDAVPSLANLGIEHLDGSPRLKHPKITSFGHDILVEGSVSSSL